MIKHCKYALPVIDTATNKSLRICTRTNEPCVEENCENKAYREKDEVIKAWKMYE